MNYAFELEFTLACGETTYRTIVAKSEAEAIGSVKLRYPLKSGTSVYVIAKKPA